MSTAAEIDPAETILEVNNIEVIYDHVILVLKGVSLTVPRGGIVAILGANGAGKTTTLKAISNLLGAERGDVTKGNIIFKGEEIQSLSPNDLVRRGCIQVMEGRHCFGHLSIEENLMTGAFTRKDGAAAIKKDLEMVYNYFPRLRERRTSLAGYTSGGEQQMCAIGRALMSKPEMILLDEPSMGLAPQLVEEIFEIVQKLNSQEGVSFLLAEQNTNIALRYATYGYILESGRVVLDGEGKTLRENEDVKEFYLGVGGEGRKSFKDVKHYKRRKRWLVHFPTIAEAKPLNRAEIKKEMLGKVINTRRFGLSIKLLYRTNGTVSARSIAGNLKGTWRYSGSTKVCTSFPSGPAKGTSCVSFTKIGEKKFRSSEGVNFTVR